MPNRHAISRITERHGEIAGKISAQHPSTRTFQRCYGTGGGMAVTVPLATADQRELRPHRIEKYVEPIIRTAVMTNLEHINIAE
jgi:hypothetical protein